MSRHVVQSRAPCGCLLAIDDEGVVHIHPCRDECPSVPALQEALRKQVGPLPTVDLRDERARGTGRASCGEDGHP